MPGDLMLPVTVIGGYLGAGKTTLVNHLLRNAGGRRLAVLVNEFGALPIDGDLIEGADDNLLTLSGGCICCSYGSDLVAALMEMTKRADSIDHIVIEASGVALPGSIAQSLTLLGGLALDAIVVVADAETVLTRAIEPFMGDTITRQLADADLVIANKIDLFGAAEVAPLVAALQAMAPSARVVTAAQADVPSEVVLGFAGATRFDADAFRPAHALSAFASVTIEIASPVDATLLAQALADPALGLVRAKGFVVDMDGAMATIQVVGARAAITMAPIQLEGAGRIVCIAQGRRLDRAMIEAAVARACR